MLEKLTSDDFRAHLHTQFLIHMPEMAPWEVELIGVTDHTITPSAAESRPGARRSFSIIFRSPRLDSYLLQHIYEVEHPVMGQLTIFLVPVGPDTQGMCYEAIFG